MRAGGAYRARPRVAGTTRCFPNRAGTMAALPNSYLYDKEIIPRVAKAILADGRFAGDERLGRGSAPLGHAQGLRSHARPKPTRWSAWCAASTTSRPSSNELVVKKR